MIVEYIRYRLGEGAGADLEESYARAAAPVPHWGWGVARPYRG